MDKRVYPYAGMLFSWNKNEKCRQLKIETYIYLEDKKKFVPIDDIEKIKTFVATKEDFMEQGFTNLEGTITFDHEEKGKIEDFENQILLKSCGIITQTFLRNMWKKGMEKYIIQVFH